MSEHLRTLTCEERNAIMGDYEGWGVYSSLTDTTGEFGRPRVETTWYAKSLPTKVFVVVHDIRHPNADYKLDDVAPCEHSLELIDDRDEE